MWGEPGLELDTVAGLQREILLGGTKTKIGPLYEGQGRKLGEDQINKGLLSEALACTLNYY